MGGDAYRTIEHPSSPRPEGTLSHPSAAGWTAQTAGTARLRGSSRGWRRLMVFVIQERHSRVSSVFWAVLLSLCQIANALGAEAPYLLEYRLPQVIASVPEIPVTNRIRSPITLAIFEPRFDRTTSPSSIAEARGAGPDACSAKGNIWIRGSSSAVQPKKPYRFELLDQNGRS